jgi:hypothetical protein
LRRNATVLKQISPDFLQFSTILLQFPPDFFALATDLKQFAAVSGVGFLGIFPDFARVAAVRRAFNRKAVKPSKIACTAFLRCYPAENTAEPRKRRECAKI